MFLFFTLFIIAFPSINFKIHKIFMITFKYIILYRDKSPRLERSFLIKAFFYIYTCMKQRIMRILFEKAEMPFLIVL